MTPPDESRDRRSAGARFFRRQAELERLRAYLEKAGAGSPQVCFVCGAAGSGKSALIRAFVSAAEQADGSLVSAVGSCNAQTGQAQPYQPFLEVLAQLTGDVEAKLAEGEISQTGAKRLSEMVRASTKALVEHAPDLIGTLVPGSSLVVKATRYAAQEAGLLKKLEQRAASDQPAPELDEKQILQQAGQLLAALADRRTLVLVLDDLQWADEATASLLYHLAQRLEGCRVLLIGAYRAFSVKSGRGGERHPLAAVLNEIKTRRGDVRVDLDAVDASERRKLSDEIVDGFPNAFDEEFRAAVFAHTDGLPLFTYELLRGMRASGGIVVDAAGRWAASPDLDWGRLPLRVEGIVEERVERLDEGLREILSVASIEGVTFSAQVLARLLGVDLRRLLRTLSRELDRRHGLIREGAVTRVGQQWRFEFQFVSTLFHQYAYDAMTRAEKTLLHAEVAAALEDLYGAENEATVVELVRHWELAGEAEKAIRCLLQAMRLGVKMRAHASVVGRYRSALELLDGIEDATTHRRLELDLRLAAGHSLLVSRGFGDAETMSSFERAIDLCHGEGRTEGLFEALQGYWQCAVAQGAIQLAQATGEELLSLAESEADAGRLAIAHRALGEARMWTGNLASASDQLAAGVRAARGAREAGGIAAGGVHPELVCLCFGAWTRQLLGFPDEATAMIDAAVRLSAEMPPFQQGYVLAGRAVFHTLRWEPEPASARARETIALAQEHDFPWWIMLGRVVLGIHEAGSGEEGLPASELVAHYRDTAETGGATFLALLAESCLRRRQTEEARSALEAAVAVAAQTGERWWEPEIERLSGEASRFAGDLDSAAEELQRARRLAAERGALTLELRATASLARLFAGRGQGADAARMLEAVLSRFTEGASTPDQREARSLLAELDSSS